MKPLLILKTIVRTPLKSLLTFILLSLVVFSLITRLAEYSIIEREIKNAAKEYQGIGTVEISEAKDSFPHTPSYITTDPRLREKNIYKSKDFAFYTTRYEPLTRDDITSVLELPYITSYDTRYMTAGISDKYYRLDEGTEYYNYTSRHIIEATLSNVDYNIIDNGVYLYELNLTNPKLIAGNPNHLSGNTEIEVIGYSNTPELGNYTGFVNPVRNDKSTLGWSSEFKGIGVPLFILMLNKDKKTTKAGERLINSIIYRVGFVEDIESFSNKFLNWKEKQVLAKERREEYIEWVKQEVDKRAEAVVGGGYRESYYKAAILIATLGETLESNGMTSGRAVTIERYKKIHSRKRAFKAEFESFN